MYAHRKGLPVEPGPCDDCELASICELGLACEAFVIYVATPWGGQRAWTDSERVPTRERYRSIYRGSLPNARPLTEDEWKRIRAAHQRERRRRDPEQAAADVQRWREENREAYNRYQRERRARLRTREPARP
jgi:hypothetical protein